MSNQALISVIFASNSSRGQILRALLNWIAPFNTPISLLNYVGHCRENWKNYLVIRCLCSFSLIWIVGVLLGSLLARGRIGEKVGILWIVNKLLFLQVQLIFVIWETKIEVVKLTQSTEMKTVKLVYRLACPPKISKTKLVPCNCYARDRMQLWLLYTTLNTMLNKI